MDRIILDHMEFYGYHGCLSEERQQALPLEDGAVCLELHPFEIATVRLALGKPA